MATKLVSYTSILAWIIAVWVQSLADGASRNAEELISNNIYLSTIIFASIWPLISPKCYFSVAGTLSQADSAILSLGCAVMRFERFEPFHRVSLLVRDLCQSAAQKSLYRPFSAVQLCLLYSRAYLSILVVQALPRYKISRLATA